MYTPPALALSEIGAPYAMQTLLAGYVCVDEGVEGDHSTQYYRLLREVVQELQELVKISNPSDLIFLVSNAGCRRRAQAKERRLFHLLLPAVWMRGRAAVGRFV